PQSFINCMSRSWSIVCVFLSQAEDGIRDDLVTGVQTCALPIWRAPAPSTPPAPESGHGRARALAAWKERVLAGWRGVEIVAVERSEERRVGKGCRWRGSARRMRRVGYRGSGARVWINEWGRKR